MVKHVKLFENWAAEDIELPEYMDPNVSHIKPDNTYHEPSSLKTLYFSDIYSAIFNTEYGRLAFNANFKSFSDYNFWKEYYPEIHVNQRDVKYKLEDCFGIPKTSILKISNSNIKSYKGLEPNDKLYTVSIINSRIENLKYCPITDDTMTLDVEDNPIISFYAPHAKGMKQIGLLNSRSTQAMDAIIAMCIQAGTKTTVFMQYDYDDIDYHSEVFCYYENKNVSSFRLSGEVKHFSPWTQIYEDPNEVENYDFLFIPFYLNSENFRTKAKEYIKNLDAGNLDRRDLW